MAEFPYMPVWCADLMADTMHLTPAQRGGYFWLLMNAWLRPNCSLPDDDRMLARLAGYDREDWAVDKAVIMEFFDFDGRRKEWTQKKQLEVRSKSAEKSAKNRKAARTRWKKEKKSDADAMRSHMRSQCQNDAYHSHSQSSKADALESGSGDAEKQLELVSDPEPKIPDHVAALDAWNAAASALELQKGRRVWANGSAKNKEHVSAVKARLKECGGLDGWHTFLEFASQHPFFAKSKPQPFSIINLTRAKTFAMIMDQGVPDDQPGHADHSDVEAARAVFRR